MDFFFFHPLSKSCGLGEVSISAMYMGYVHAPWMPCISETGGKNAGDWAW